jgi:hypothetical protein
MFEIAPEPEFSAWFESLSESDAEQVAGALEVIANAGTVLRPAQVSRALLWYDGLTGTPAAGPPDAAYLRSLGLNKEAVDEYLIREGWVAAPAEEPSALASATADVRELLAWRADITRVFDSEAFRARVAELDPALSAEVADEVERLKDRLRAGRIEMLLRLGASKRSGKIREIHDAIREPFLRVLALVGIEPRSIERSDAGLRELTITSTSPKLRVLFGLDPAHRRIVAMLGESLTRNYYGDSVRRAEARWAAYCSQQESAHSP